MQRFDVATMFHPSARLPDEEVDSLLGADAVEIEADERALAHFEKCDPFLRAHLGSRQTEQLYRAKKRRTAWQQRNGGK
jgi:hypothetical protein